MKAVARLVLSYFTCTKATRVFSAVGLALIVGSFFALRDERQWGFELTVAMAGVASFYLGSALMPLMFGRMAMSHVIGVLPYGRVKLLTSAFITVAIVALPVPTLVAFGYPVAVTGRAPDPATLARIHQTTVSLFWFTYTSGLLMLGWLYLAMWFVTSQRSIAGYLKGLLVIMVIVLAPPRTIVEFDDETRRNVILLAITWGLFGVVFLFLKPSIAGRLGFGAVARLTGSGRLGSGAVRRLTGSAWLGFQAARRLRASGREIDLMLGTANPWLLAAAQAVPVALAAKIGFYSAAVWLYYLTIFSTVAGAIAGQAAERSRALWLRGNWTRAELFAEVERSFWRHNSYVLGVLLVLMVGIGSYSGLPVTLLAAGLPLLALGTILSTYLGLMITRGLHWLEAILAIVVMLTLMAVAVLATRSSGDLAVVIALEVVLACMALVFRAIARRRWGAIDWMICRPERALSARATS